MASQIKVICVLFFIWFVLDKAQSKQSEGRKGKATTMASNVLPTCSAENFKSRSGMKKSAVICWDPSPSTRWLSLMVCLPKDKAAGGKPPSRLEPLLMPSDFAPANPEYTFRDKNSTLDSNKRALSKYQMSLKDIAKAVNASGLPPGSKRHAKLSFDQNKITLSIGKDKPKDKDNPSISISKSLKSDDGVPEIVIVARTEDNETAKDIGSRPTSIRPSHVRKALGHEYSIAEYKVPDKKRTLKDKTKEKKVKENNYNFYLSQLLSSQEDQASGETKTQKQFSKWKRQWQLLNQRPKANTEASRQSLSLKSLDGSQPHFPPPSKRRVSKLGSEESEERYSRRRHRKRPKELEISVEDDLDQELELAAPKRRRKFGRRSKRRRGDTRDTEDYEEDYDEEEDEIAPDGQSEEEPEEQAIELAPPLPKSEKEQQSEGRARTDASQMTTE